MAVSKIEWTDRVWNPSTGCTKISPGCDNCYAERMSKRLQGMGSVRQPKYVNGFQITAHKSELTVPKSWKKPCNVFVNSMSDLFHDQLQDSFVQDVFIAMQQEPQHKFQVLTKRSKRLQSLSPILPWPANVWMGVSIENDRYMFRLDNLKKTGAVLKFISFEPLLGPITSLDLTGIDWVIVGGESGPKSRSIDPDWVRAIRDVCVAKNVPFFFKQWGGVKKKKAGRLLDGRTWEQMP